MRRAFAIVTQLAVAAAALILPAPCVAAAAAYRAEPYEAIAHGAVPIAGAIVGHYVAPRMSIEVALAPRDKAELEDVLSRQYDPRSPDYHRWLQKGQFDAEFAPTRETLRAVAGYLESRGLTLERSSSPFLIRASGSSEEVESAFRTTLAQVRLRDGTTGYANVSPVRLPTRMASSVIAVIGMTQTPRPRSAPRAHFHGPSSFAHPFAKSCEAPYPTATELFAYYGGGFGFPLGYGGGPSCSGLTAGQVNALYSAPPPAPNVQGSGVRLAVLEQSAYTASDLSTWWQSVYPSGAMPTVTEEDVDGGPLNPQCPQNDYCYYKGYWQDVQVDGDVEMLLTIAPAAASVTVYDTPFDYYAQTTLDGYAQIASDDTADVVDVNNDLNNYSCEQYSPPMAASVDTYLEQMAMQGQSVFESTGNLGAFTCAYFTSNGLGVAYAAADPWVTAVGGTSFESYNPRLQKIPQHPNGVETVWNSDGLCADNGTIEGGESGFFWCGATGAGGGGDSSLWGAPSFQQGPGVINAYSEYGDGSTLCTNAPVGALCREIPDVSANADQYTPYSEYCTGTDPTSQCTFSAYEPTPGWFDSYGTGWASALWAGIVADRDSYVGARTGDAAELFYTLIQKHKLLVYFHNITGAGQSVTNNGYYPTMAGYSQATGLGSPKMGELITNSP